LLDFKASLSDFVVNFVPKVAPSVLQSDVVNAPQTHERRNSENNRTARLENSPYLVYGLAIIIKVFKDIKDGNKVKFFISKGQKLGIAQNKLLHASLVREFQGNQRNIKSNNLSIIAKQGERATSATTQIKDESVSAFWFPKSLKERPNDKPSPHEPPISVFKASHLFQLAWRHERTSFEEELSNLSAKKEKSFFETNFEPTFPKHLPCQFHLSTYCCLW